MPKLEIDSYELYVKKETLIEIKSLSSSLQTKKWTNIIFEEDEVLFKKITQLSNNLGIDCHYITINQKQYMKSLNKLDLHKHLLFVEKNYQKILVTADIISIHSPYLLFLLHNNSLFGNVLWHSYAALSEKWFYILKPYIDQCAATVVGTEDFYSEKSKGPLYQIFPYIDPLRQVEKMPQKDNDKLEFIKNHHSISIVCFPMANHDYTAKILSAFRQLDRSCYLIFVSCTEDKKYVKKLQKEVANEGNIEILQDLPSCVVHSILKVSTVAIYLNQDVPSADNIVANAMWYHTPVIGLNTPAISMQVAHQKSGYLLDEVTEKSIFAAINFIIENNAKAIGEEGHKYVQKHFLLPEFLYRYFQLLSFYSDMSTEIPPFRLNELSYNELIQDIRPKHPYLSIATETKVDLSNQIPRGTKTRYANLVGGSSKMQDLFSTIDKVANSDASVLIIGETGTGKELVAAALHSKSKRNKYELVSVNCAAIPETLQEATLFGYEKGAFTGAQKNKSGLIEKANNGTLFLDELACASMELQAKLLRVLETKKFSRVGSTKEIAVDFRIVCATNVDPQQQAREGNFREDLWYRINSITLELPALREREDDVVLLAEHFANLYARRNKIDLPKWNQDTLTALRNYSWPGNIRELKHAVEFALIMDGDSVISFDDLPKHITQIIKSKSGFSGKLQEARSTSERDYFIQLLQETKGNVSQTAKKSGLTRPYLYEKLKKLQINIRDYRK
ncbi:sigma 54-interacting transcriptional regulator [Candidatus Uabimicrobium amorphum]|uniref:Sigma-54-dependent Fis family transcriptional regulator n=1 Tax=Uabimicrobium amorphum TaxID=2596890 RepID=A0A5S9F6P9_UABAM|nr:sigma 54-interacting transcriptional regulator [Candidatus Uabimicrobium amorphum]BBM86919.1 sigma-54-dependent Fis family transcriptional regulator [Candidatus Uabimicrobium amorphum]